MTTSSGLRIVLSHLYGWPEVRRGAERYVHELSAALAWLGHQPHILTTSRVAPRHDLVLGVPVTRFPRREEARSPAALRPQLAFAARCAAYVRKHRPDVWHANSLFDAGMAVAVPQVRSVFTAHGPADRQSLTSPAKRAAFRSARAADAFVCVSPGASAQVEREFGIRPLTISPGVDTRVFTPGAERHDQPVVLYVGTLDAPNKNLPLLLDAAAVASRAQPDLEIWLAGAGNAEAVQRAAPPAVRQRLRFLGVLEGADLVQAYRRAWAVALVSEREVFGMSVVEGLACGTPAVVLADGWGPSGIVTAGTGVAAGHDEVGAALLEVIELSRTPETALRCRALAEQYDWRNRIAPRLVEVYDGG